jgi:hypothetical protein
MSVVVWYPYIIQALLGLGLCGAVSLILSEGTIIISTINKNYSSLNFINYTCATSCVGKSLDLHYYVQCNVWLLSFFPRGYLEELGNRPKAISKHYLRLHR